MLSSSPAALKWPCGYLRCLRHLAPASYFTGLLGSVIGIIGGAVVTETIRSCGKPHLQLPFEPEQHSATGKVPFPVCFAPRVLATAPLVQGLAC
jgi:hypothetical protein